MCAPQGCGRLVPPSSRFARIAGLTVIEFLLAVATFSIVFVSVVAGASNRNEQLRVDETARSLQLTMAYARNQAITRRSSVRVCPASEQLECSDKGNWNSGWLVIDWHSGEVLRLTEPGDPGVQVLAGSGVSRHVQFNTLGDAYSTAGDFLVCLDGLGDYSSGLRVSAVGLVEHVENQPGRCPG